MWFSGFLGKGERLSCCFVSPVTNTDSLGKTESAADRALRVITMDFNESVVARTKDKEDHLRAEQEHEAPGIGRQSAPQQHVVPKAEKDDERVSHVESW